jgi:hypothetical protein
MYAMLKNLIKSLNYKSLSAQEVYNKLKEKNIQYIDDSFWTWAGIAELVGNQGAEALRIALTDGGMGWAVHQLGGKGINLSKDDVQNALYYLHGIGVPGMSLLALAVKRNISILDKHQISTSIEEIESVLLDLKLEDLINQKIDQARDRFNNYLININSWNGDVNTEPQL